MRLVEVNSSKEMRDFKKQKETEVKKEEKLSRREAMKKMGFTAFSVSTMLLLLNQPGKAQDTSLAPDNPDTW